jgi:hypothetical protein
VIKKAQRTVYLSREHSGFIDKVIVKKEGKYGISSDVCMYTGTEDMKRK